MIVSSGVGNKKGEEEDEHGGEVWEEDRRKCSSRGILITFRCI